MRVPDRILKEEENPREKIYSAIYIFVSWLCFV